MSIFICNNEIICNSSLIENEQYRNYTKDVNEKIKCANKVIYIILEKIMHSLFKVCKKNSDDEISKNKNKNKQ